MKIVLTIASALSVAHYALALVCPTTPKYTSAIKKFCIGDEIKDLWPDYKNASQYYRCQGEENPILESCFPYTIFNFYEQKCTRCDEYLPAPQCEELTSKSNCETFTPVAENTTPAPGPFCNLEKPFYKTSFIPKCVGNDIYILWPNYNDVTKYYSCQGLYNPKLKKCASDTYFNYYAQMCTDCQSFVEAPVCEKLPFDKSNKCEKI